MGRSTIVHENSMWAHGYNFSFKADANLPVHFSEIFLAINLDGQRKTTDTVIGIVAARVSPLVQAVIEHEVIDHPSIAMHSGRKIWGHDKSRGPEDIRHPTSRFIRFYSV